MTIPVSNQGERERTERQKAIDGAVREVEGLFDSVIIIGSWTLENGGLTACVNANAGNWYAQSGMMNHLLKRREAMAESEGREMHEDCREERED